MVRLTVQDNGIGISPQHHERIWNVFERLHDRDAYPGTGIGLAIVKRAMGRMRGSYGVDSDMGKGSKFWIELPDAAQSNTAMEGT
jgi:signal transduction histidine kinase